MGPLVRKLDERFTYGDYLAWDDGERWELIDGVPYNMTPAPQMRHQQILVDLIRQFASWLKDKPCQVFAAPFDVRLPEADESDALVETMVQPDLLVICDKGNWTMLGAGGRRTLCWKSFLSGRPRRI